MTTTFKVHTIQEIEEWYAEIICDLTTEDIAIIDNLIKSFTEQVKHSILKKENKKLVKENLRLIQEKNFSVMKYNSEFGHDTLELEPQKNRWQELKILFKEMFKCQMSLIKPSNISKDRINTMMEGLAIWCFWIIPVSILTIILYFIFGIIAMKVIFTLFTIFSGALMLVMIFGTG